MKTWVRILWAGTIGLSGFAAYQAIRWSRLSKRGSEQVKVAEGFPKDYGTGDPIVAMGDSTALGVGVSRVEDTMMAHMVSKESRRILNLAVSGATLAEVLDQLPNVPAGPLPLVVLSVSANDAVHGTEHGAFRNDLELLLTALERDKAARVVLTTTPNFLTTPALPFPVRNGVAARANALSKIVRHVATHHPSVRLADLDREGTLSKDEYAADEFHPNAKGYRRWAGILRRAAESR